MPSEQKQYDELALYTLQKKDKHFIHQYAVDAFTAQTANKHTKPIALTFALIGLYLHVEKMYSGKQVQQAHMKLAESKRLWPQFTLAEYRGDIRVGDVLKASPGPERDEMINKWSHAVWETWHEARQEISKIAGELLGVN